MILVTMTGAKTGRELCSPLVFSTDGGDRRQWTQRRQAIRLT
ncbi:hypothetical protein [Candidatus Poriferisodalis sp.]